MIKKSELNSNIRISEGNMKSKCTDDITFLTWSLPSGKCCPYATDMCRKRCFAKKNENFTNVKESRERNLNESKKDTFVQDMIKYFQYHMQKPKNTNKLIIVRIHTSGDFYSQEYFDKWVEIAEHFRNDNKILFQAYTKSIIFLTKWIKNRNDIKENKVNIHFVYSIWEDTNEKDIALANQLGLQTFTASPKNKIPMAIDKGYFLCNGNCGNCKECYTGTSQKIVIPYH